MALPVPNLDDRRFQDLVDDAKRLVQQKCPEWTDHNVSDPGVTLIETFARMTCSSSACRRPCPRALSPCDSNATSKAWGSIRRTHRCCGKPGTATPGRPAKSTAMAPAA